MKRRCEITNVSYSNARQNRQHAQLIRKTSPCKRSLIRPHSDLRALHIMRQGVQQVPSLQLSPCVGEDPGGCAKRLVMVHGNKSAFSGKGVGRKQSDSTLYTAGATSSIIADKRLKARQNGRTCQPNL